MIKRLLIEAKDKLLITKTDDTVRVGPYEISQNDDIFQVMREDVDIDYFNSKKAAIAYALSLYNKLPTTKIKEFDDKIGKHRSDLRFYRRSLLIAQKRKDEARETIMQCRIDASFRDMTAMKHRLLEEIKNIRIA